MLFRSPVPLSHQGLPFVSQSQCLTFVADRAESLILTNVDQIGFLLGGDNLLDCVISSNKEQGALELKGPIGGGESGPLAPVEQRTWNQIVPLQNELPSHFAAFPLPAECDRSLLRPIILV